MPIVDPGCGRLAHLSQQSSVGRSDTALQQCQSADVFLVKAVETAVRDEPTCSHVIAKRQQAERSSIVRDVRSRGLMTRQRLRRSHQDI